MDLAQAINSNQVKHVAAAIAAGHDVNRPHLGQTPLFKAVMEAKLEIVDLLLSHGADWKKRDQATGWTPLMMASINSHKSSRRYFSGRAIRDSRRIAQLLRDAGASDPETEFVLGNEGDEPGLVAAALRLKPKADAKVLVLDGAVVLVPPRMKKKLADALPFLDTIEKFARQRGLSNLVQSLRR